jgi:hypothetical protein
MSSQGIVSGKETCDSPGLYPVKGQNSSLVPRQGPEINSRACPWVLPRLHLSHQCWFANQRLCFMACSRANFIFWLCSLNFTFSGTEGEWRWRWFNGWPPCQALAAKKGMDRIVLCGLIWGVHSKVLYLLLRPFLQAWLLQYGILLTSRLQIKQLI